MARTRIVTQQAKRAIAKMKAAGWQRSEFSVRTDTHRYRRNGREIREYGRALIHVKADKETLYMRIAGMLQAGLDIIVLVFESGTPSYPIVQDNYHPEDRGTYQVCYYRKDD